MCEVNFNVTSVKQCLQTETEKKNVRKSKMLLKLNGESRMPRYISPLFVRVAQCPVSASE